MPLFSFGLSDVWREEWSRSYEVALQRLMKDKEVDISDVTEAGELFVLARYIVVTGLA